MYLKIINLKTVDSTNNYASHLASNGAKEITVVRADTQKSGKGRMGKLWHSPPGEGIYASFIFRPQNKSNDIYSLPLIFSLAAARFIEDLLDLKKKDQMPAEENNLRIKLPNDIMLNGKKVAGILVEAKTTGHQLQFVVAGIGINLNNHQNCLPDNATSLYRETGKKYEIGKKFPALVKEVVKVYNDFKKNKIEKLLDEIFLYQQETSKERMQQIFSRKEEVVHFL